MFQLILLFLFNGIIKYHLYHEENQLYMHNFTFLVAKQNKLVYKSTV